MEKVHDLYTPIDIHKKGSTLDCENFKKDLTHRPHGQSANDDTNREVENSPGRTFIRRTGRVSQGQDHDTTDNHVETDSGEGQTQGHKAIQLLCKLQKGV